MALSLPEGPELNRNAHKTLDAAAAAAADPPLSPWHLQLKMLQWKERREFLALDPSLEHAEWV